MLVTPNQIKAGRALLTGAQRSWRTRWRHKSNDFRDRNRKIGRFRGTIVPYSLCSTGRKRWIYGRWWGAAASKQNRYLSWPWRLQSLFDDVYEIAKTNENPDICITNVNEAQYEHWLGSYEPIHVKRMAALESNAKLRVLVRENDTHLTSSILRI